LRLGYLSEMEWRELDELRSAASKLTWGLYEAVGRRLRARTG
jgi:hypothetical protein